MPKAEPQCRSAVKLDGRIHRCVRNRHKSGLHRNLTLTMGTDEPTTGGFFTTEVELQWASKKR